MTSTTIMMMEEKDEIVVTAKNEEHKIAHIHTHTHGHAHSSDVQQKPKKKETSKFGNMKRMCLGHTGWSEASIQMHTNHAMAPPKAFSGLPPIRHNKSFKNFPHSSLWFESQLESDLDCFHQLSSSLDCVVSRLAVWFSFYRFFVHLRRANVCRIASCSVDAMMQCHFDLAVPHWRCSSILAP